MPAVPAPHPPNETERLAALQELRLLDTLPEQVFDDIVLLASQICGTPIGLVSLVDGERQWFKARIGLAAPETHRDLRSAHTRSSSLNRCSSSKTPRAMRAFATTRWSQATRTSASTLARPS